MWKALDTADVPSCFPAFVRVLLLTAQRREEVSRMDWSEIGRDVWTVLADRHKTGAEAGDKLVPLTRAVLELLGRLQKKGFVFSTTTKGAKPFSGPL